ncbi:uncharacterized protein LOC125683809 [Ostrea edulis]|uniref:uncharacterized protein LOC125683809 n=1 Tax=Ostrea edulis TaxID=37623 RepID=UPI0020954981|nr:uncharacterized protein LOC125683809 [Ostrea edulis]
MDYTFGDCNRHNKCLYNELNIQIGFEESIKMRRDVKEFEVNMKDKLSILHPYLETICTGSVAEGFRHGKTDRDYMKVLKDVTVLDSSVEMLYDKGRKNSERKLNLVISKDSDYWKEGYVLLKFRSDGVDTSQKHVQCIKSALLRNYVSSHKFKEWWVKECIDVDPNIHFFVHGPCISLTGVSSDHDMAFSLECPFWPPQAKEWIDRSRLWPSKEMVREITLDGCHLVPLGPVKDVTDDLFWRLSFNRAEKKLVFAFNQTQFLCYGLLKIILKECIEKMDSYPENTLCSYFIKTLTFWIIQDTVPELWRPENIVICCLMCLLRLTCWIKNERCPNFFIPERNMFQSKVYGLAKNQLLKTFKGVFRMGLWNCLAKCGRRFYIMTHHKDTTMPFLKPYFVDQSYLREFRVLSSSFLTEDLCHFDKMEESKNQTNLSEVEIQFVTCQRLSMYQRQAVKASSHEEQIKFFTKAKELDLTRGSLMLATCLYGIKQYSNVIELIDETKMKFGKFTFFAGINNADVLNFDEVLLQYAFSVTPLRHSLQEKREMLLAMDMIIQKETDVFTKTPNRKNIPDKIQFDMLFQRTSMVIHPLVYLYFLEFLCHKHLGRSKDAIMALGHLEATVFNVCKHDDLHFAHLFLGIAFEDEKRFDDALHQYEVSFSKRESFSSALCRTYLMKKYIQSCCPVSEAALD